MLHAVRLAVVTLVCVGLLALFCANMVRAVRTGRIHYSGNSVAARTRHPVALWLLFPLNLTFAGLILLAWLKALAS
jgi:hypothetical protein